MREQRLYERFKIELAAKYKLLHSSADAELFDATIVDIGAAGFYFLTKDLPDLGQTIELNISIDSEKLILTVVVIWLGKGENSEYEVGVKIVDASMEDQTKLVRFYLDHLLGLCEKRKELSMT